MALVLLRGAHLAAMLSVLGTLALALWVAPGQQRPALRRLALVGVMAAIGFGIAWYIAEAAAIAWASSVAEVVAAIPSVALETQFGQVMLVRLALLLVGLLLVTAAGRGAGAAPAAVAGASPLTRTARRTGASAFVPQSWPKAARPSTPALLSNRKDVDGAPARAMTAGGRHRSMLMAVGMTRRAAVLCLALAMVLVGLAVAAQAILGHAGAASGVTGWILVASVSLHVVAAGVWLGGLLPLALSVRDLPTPSAAQACRRFSGLGIAAVLTLLGTSFVQGWLLVGNLPALVGTAYGRLVLLKLVLFFSLVGLAILHRWVLTPALAGADPLRARRRMLRSVAAETALGLLIVLIAALLASQAPAAHQQPDWPFAWRPSLVAMEDPDLQREVVLAGAAIALALLVLAASLLARRGRIVALLLVAGIALWQGPSLRLLLVPAYPTSYYTSPTGFAAAAIVHGQALFAANCVACHGVSGRGDGPAASGLRLRPADLTASHLWEHSDGELFWWLSRGVEGPDGRLAMPGFAGTLSATDRWDLIDYVRAHNAGAAMAAFGSWPALLRAPALPIACDGRPAGRLADLHGAVVHVVADAPGTTPLTVPPQDGIAVVTLHLARAKQGCSALSPTGWAAYAQLAGVSPDALAGTEFLIDPAGWLRAISLPGAAQGWRDPAELLATVRQICAHPVTTQAGGDHDHPP